MGMGVLMYGYAVLMYGYGSTDVWYVIHSL